MGKTTTLTKSITSLIETIRQEIITGKMNIEKTIETEKTKTYWNIGKHIFEHLLEYDDRAGYGDKLFITLENELNISASTLYRTVQFYETYPKIFAALRKLEWSHYILLLTVKGEEKRKEYEQKVISQELSVKELRELIKSDKQQKNENKISILTEKRGLLLTYKLKKFNMENNTPLFIDLGFRVYIDGLIEGKKTYTEESIVQVKKVKKEYTLLLMDDISPTSLYTYKGYIIEVIDGDTFWLNLHLGLNTWTNQKIRLRGVNTEKIETEAGQEARNYSLSRLKPCKFIIVKTYWMDKYNRYVADIFYDKNETNAVKVAKTGKYFNQELLDKGLAEKY